MSYTLTEKEIAHFASQLPEDTKVIRIEGLNKPGGYDVWDFVEQFYPNYEESDDICFLGDYKKIINESWEEGDTAHLLYKDLYDLAQSECRNADHDELEVMIDIESKRRISELKASIFQDTIENFIKIMKGK